MWHPLRASAPHPPRDWTLTGWPATGEPSIPCPALPPFRWFLAALPRGHGPSCGARPSGCSCSRWECVLGPREARQHRARSHSFLCSRVLSPTVLFSGHMVSSSHVYLFLNFSGCAVPPCRGCEGPVCSHLASWRVFCSLSWRRAHLQGVSPQESPCPRVTGISAQRPSVC